MWLLFLDKIYFLTQYIISHNFYFYKYIFNFYIGNTIMDLIFLKESRCIILNLQSGKFYWPTTLKNPPTYPTLEEDIKCDVLIVGGGSSSALCAYYLSKWNLNVVVVDKNKCGLGSTATNTALIQYLGDKMFFELVNSFGEDFAARHLKLCEEAINEIETASNNIPINPEFTRRDSLYYASYKEDIEKINKEYNLLVKHSFNVDLISEDEIGKNYPFKKHCAIYSYNDGELNPYKFTLGLLESSRQSGVRVFENTEIHGQKFEKDYSTFYTNQNKSIKAKYVIFASGYENLEFKVEKNTTISSSYAVITNPVEDLSSWYKRTLIWETARPYIYMRTTKDNRIIIGGLDEDTTYADKRDSKIMNKKDKLIQEFNKLFPNINVYPEYYLGAFYGGTHDGLPIIGIYDEFPNCYFLYAYGDNGIVYSVVLAKIITDLIGKGSSNDLDIYHQRRPMLALK